MIIAAVTLPAAGAASLGVFIGYLAWYFIVRFGGERFTTDGLTAVVGVLVGGAVIDFLKTTGAATRDWWWYPIGLVIGWGVFIVFRFLNWMTGHTADGKGPLPALLPPNLVPPQHGPL